MKTLFLFLLALAAPLPFVRAAGETAPDSLTWMPMGDSITEGGDAFTCYLFSLWAMLS